MISSLRGVLLSKHADHVVLEAAGIGYEVFVTGSTLAQLPEPGREAFLHVAESFGMYGGGETLYGFATAPEKSMFLAFKDNVPGTGAKKALEHLEKASKSLPDFRRAIMEKDARLLTGVFGFTKKTADKLIEGLKEKLEAVHVPGHEKLARIGIPAAEASGALAQALNGLSALGYKPAEARSALQAVAEETAGQDLAAEQILRLALKKL